MASSVSFYSTKLKKEVEIPSNKVCGYRIANDIMKKGYSDGVKAGINNGVVDQRLSRFSTVEEREKSSSNCQGNTNWLNYKRGASFNKPESADKQFSLARTGFKAGTFNYQTRPAQEITGINIREGRGNRLIERDNFLAPDIQGRRVPLFSDLQTMAVAEAGTIQGSLFNSKLAEKATIRVPDPTDFEWLREKDRLTNELTRVYEAPKKPDGTNFYSNAEISAFVARELQINKPLGRDQRTIFKTTDDIANSTLDINKKITEIAQEVREGRGESLVGQRAITAQLIQLLQDTASISNLSRTTLETIVLLSPRLGIPTNYKQIGLPSRFIDYPAYLKNRGTVNLLLLNRANNAQPPVNLNNPIINQVSTGRLLGQAMPLDTAIKQMQTTPLARFLDLERSALISEVELKQVFKNPTFQSIDFDLDPAALRIARAP